MPFRRHGALEEPIPHVAERQIESVGLAIVADDVDFAGSDQASDFAPVYSWLSRQPERGADLGQGRRRTGAEVAGEVA
jgi:hypothetical protein